MKGSLFKGHTIRVLRVCQSQYLLKSQITEKYEMPGKHNLYSRGKVNKDGLLNAIDAELSRQGF